MDNDLKRDEARVNLHLGMKGWITPGGTKDGWRMIEESINALMVLEGLSTRDILRELSVLQEELGYTDDDIVDLDYSIRDLLGTRH